MKTRILIVVALAQLMVQTLMAQASFDGRFGRNDRDRDQHFKNDYKNQWDDADRNDYDGDDFKNVKCSGDREKDYLLYENAILRYKVEALSDGFIDRREARRIQRMERQMDRRFNDRGHSHR